MRPVRLMFFGGPDCGPKFEIQTLHQSSLLETTPTACLHLPERPGSISGKMILSVSEDAKFGRLDIIGLCLALPSQDFENSIASTVGLKLHMTGIANDTANCRRLQNNRAA